MRTEVNYMERNAFETIEQVINKTIAKKQASVILECSIRTIERKMQKYQNGIDDFRHKNCNKKSNKATSRELVNEIIKLRKDIYYDFSYVHFLEKLNQNHNIFVNLKTLISILETNFILSPFAHRKTRKKISQKMNENNIQANQENDYLFTEEILDKKKCHPLQPRKEFFGEHVQTDASIHNWIKGEKWALHAFIDESTGIILSAFFDKQETLFGYYSATKQMFLKYGTPKEILTDKRTVFYSFKKDGDRVESNTQYGFMCHQLGITLTSTSVAQNKGKIERLWGSLQKRIPQELGLVNIATIETANEWLIGFIEKYNAEFALKIDQNKNIFIPWAAHQVDIDFALSINYTRRTANGSIIKFLNKNYGTFDEHGNRINLAKKQDIMVVITFNGHIFANYHTYFYVLIEVTKEEFIRENIEVKAKTIKQTKTQSNKWRNTNWIYFQKKWKENSSTYNFSI